ncbi:MAG TPA: hypothetical protein VI911_10625 [Patescibacteria group bacterium]|nr:hypothetical protein [Patescibacteria group bacterium]
MITDDNNMNANRQIGECLDKGYTLVKITVTKYYALTNEPDDPPWSQGDIFAYLYRKYDEKRDLLYQHYNFNTAEIEESIEDPVKPFGDICPSPTNSKELPTQSI